MSVYLLWHYGDLVDVYADAETAETDSRTVLDQARADPAGPLGDEYPSRVHADETTTRIMPRVTPR